MKILRYVWYGSNYTPTDAQLAADTDFLEVFHPWLTEGDNAKSLTTNPLFRILAYFDTPFTLGQYDDCNMTSTFLNNIWILKDSSGNLLSLAGDTPPIYFWDIGNPDAQQWVANMLLSWLTAHPNITGVMLDDIQMTNDWFWNPSSAAGSEILDFVNPRTNAQWTYQEVSDAVIAFLNVLRATIGSNNLIFANGIVSGDRFYDSDHNAYLSQLFGSDVPLDGIVDEGLFSNPAYATYADWPSETSWVNSVNFLVWLHNNWSAIGTKYQVSLCELAQADQSGTPNLVPTVPPGATQESYMLFCFASELLASSDYPCLCATAYTFNSDGYYQLLFSENISTALGAPSGSYSKDSGLSIYRRQFTNGLVLVNPSGTSYTAYIGSGYVEAVHGVSQASSITLAANTGIVLLRSSFYSPYTSLPFTALFSDLSKWQIDMGTWTLVSGGVQPTGALDEIIHTGQSTWKDYQVTATAQILAAGEASVIVRMQDPQNFYMLSIGSWSHQYSIAKCVNDVFTEIASSGAASSNGAGTYTIKAVVTGGSQVLGSACLLQLYVNNTLVLSANDAAFSSGMVGLHAWQNNTTTDTVIFNEVTASFIQFNLTIASSSYGTTSPAAGTYGENSGSNVSITATSGVGNALSSWGINLGSGNLTIPANGNTLTITINSNVTVTPYFSALPAAAPAYAFSYWNGTVWIPLTNASLDHVMEELDGTEEFVFNIPNTSANATALGLSDPTDENVLVQITYNGQQMYLGTCTGSQMTATNHQCICYNPVYLALKQAPYIVNYNTQGSLAADWVASQILQKCGINASSSSLNIISIAFLGVSPIPNVNINIQNANAFDALVALAQALNLDYWSQGAPNLAVNGTAYFYIGIRDATTYSDANFVYEATTQRSLDRSQQYKTVIVNGIDQNGNSISGQAGTGTGPIKPYTYPTASDVPTLNNIAAYQLSMLNSPSTGNPLSIPTNVCAFWHPGQQVTTNRPDLALVGTFAIQRITKQNVLSTVEVETAVLRLEVTLQMLSEQLQTVALNQTNS